MLATEGNYLSRHNGFGYEASADCLGVNLLELGHGFAGFDERKGWGLWERREVSGWWRKSGGGDHFAKK